MNPVVLAAVAISLLAVGTVSMSSLSAQQATSSASIQKTAFERDRLAEQANAYISAIAAAGADASSTGGGNSGGSSSTGGNTKATIKNTGSSPVTVDHCLALSPSGNLRPTATKVAVGQMVSPGAAIDVIFSGAVAADDIKCVTSKGTVLPVRLAVGEGSTTLDPADYIDSFSVMASVTMVSTQHFANGAHSPWQKPSPPAQGKGSLTYQIPVSKPITVNYLAREAPDGTSSVVVPDGSSVQYSAGQMISVPIAGPTNRITVKFTPQGSAEQQQQQQQSLTATIRPNFVDVSSLAGNTRTSSASLMVGTNEGQRYNPTTFQSWTDWVATYSFSAGASGLVGANGWIRNPQPSPPLVCSGTTTIDGKTYCANMPATLQSSPEIVQTYSFPAPKSTVKVTLYYDASARFSQANCHLSYCNGGMSVALELGEGGAGTGTGTGTGGSSINTNVARTDNPGRSCPYSNSCYDYNDYYYQFTRSGPVTFMLTGLTPGEQVEIPVKFRVNLTSENGTAYFNGYRYDKGAINYTGSIASQLFID